MVKGLDSQFRGPSFITTGWLQGWLTQPFILSKSVTDGLPSFRTNLSVIGTLTYKLAKFLVPLLEPLTTNEYTIKDSFTFTEELQSFDSKLVMASFDTESLFTKLPLEETIDLCVANLFQDRTQVDNFSKDPFRELLTRTISESLIWFDQQFHKQHDGVAIGFPLGSMLANLFLCYHEKTWLQNCPSEFKPVIYRILSYFFARNITLKNSEII